MFHDVVLKGDNKMTEEIIKLPADADISLEFERHSLSEAVVRLNVNGIKFAEMKIAEGLTGTFELTGLKTSKSGNSIEFRFFENFKLFNLDVFKGMFSE